METENKCQNLFCPEQGKQKIEAVDIIVRRIIHEYGKSGIKVDFIEEKVNDQFKVIFNRN